MKNFKLFMVRLMYFLSLRLHIYTTWSKIHRFIFDSAGAGLPLPIFHSIEQYQVREMVWRPDGLTDLGDAICTPEMAWFRFKVLGQPIGDCDEFAILLSNVIQKAIDWHVWSSDIKDPKFMTIGWMTAAGKFEGHNVCLMTEASTGKFGYMDYDVPHFFGTKQDVVDAVRLHYAGAGALSTGWAVHSPKLQFEEFHWA